MPQTLQRIPECFFLRDVLEVAPELLGNYLVQPEGHRLRSYRITEVEAYRGETDRACHANKGRTRRTEIMYHSGGHLYVYLIYGMYWMLNIVAGPEDIPQAILIRGVEGFNGPGKLTREIGIDGSYYGEHLCISERIWLAGFGIAPEYRTAPRVGIDYSGEPWVSKPWRYILVK